MSARYEVQGVTVRFFPSNAAAQKDARLRTKLTRREHTAFTSDAYTHPLVRAGEALFDVDGQLPEGVAKVLLHYVGFGEVARSQLGMQCQYACRYLEDPEISADIRWQGSTSDYHFITIHKDDVETFVKRALAWRRAKGIIA